MPHPDEPASELPARALDNLEDREELRQRYYGLLQELRVLLPGVQVLVAFLLTAPFASRFDGLDAMGESAYAFALVTSMLAVVCFTAPTVLHRVGDRRARRERLEWGIRMTRVGILLVAVALLSALFAVGRLAFGLPGALVAVSAVGGGMAVAWLVIPVAIGPAEHDEM